MKNDEKGARVKSDKNAMKSQSVLKVMNTVMKNILEIKVMKTLRKSQNSSLNILNIVMKMSHKVMKTRDMNTIFAIA